MHSIKYFYLYLSAIINKYISDIHNGMSYNCNFYSTKGGRGGGGLECVYLFLSKKIYKGV